MTQDRSPCALLSSYPGGLELMNVLLSRLTAGTLVKLSIERMVQNGAEEVRKASLSVSRPRFLHIL